MDQDKVQESHPKNTIIKRATWSFSTHPVHKTLGSAANLARLLPTGTVLAFRTLAPSFSNKGECQVANKCLTSALLALCSIACFVSSFIDSFTDSDGKVYFGIATFKGLHVFNPDDIIIYTGTTGDDEDGIGYNIDLSRFRISLIDFVHAFVSVFVFLVFAFSDSDVEKCFFRHKSMHQGPNNLDVLVMNLPLAAGFFASFLFMMFPTTRRGIGYADDQIHNSLGGV